MSCQTLAESFFRACAFVACRQQALQVALDVGETFSFPFSSQLLWGYF